MFSNFQSFNPTEPQAELHSFLLADQLSKAEPIFCYICETFWSALSCKWNCATHRPEIREPKNPAQWINNMSKGKTDYCWGQQRKMWTSADYNKTSSFRSSSVLRTAAGVGEKCLSNRVLSSPGYWFFLGEGKGEAF